MGNRLYTTDEAAKLVGLSEDYIRELASKGRLTAKKFGRLWMLTEEDIDTLRNRKPRGRPKKAVTQ
jgi:excisionase family DNA binding protein